MGLVATSEIHAARAAADVLSEGGTAVDAALCAAACLTVTEPTSNGLGGDLFALVWDGSQVHALASSGAAPQALTPDHVPGDAVPHLGWLPVTVPGQVAGWGALAERFARFDLERLLSPAITYARQGFAVGPVTAAAWARAVPHFASFDAWTRAFTVDGRAPRAGERWANPDLGSSLERIARAGSSAFYGELGRRIAEHAAATGGWLTEADLAAHEVRWETPLSVRFGGRQVLGMGAPTQGVVALRALGLLAPLTDVRVHDRIEAIKLAFADAYASVSDPAWLQVQPADLLTAASLDVRRQALDRERAGPVPPPPGLDGGTVLVCTADDDGRLCSLIQSNFHGFGSGIVVPGTGIALQNRGAGFSLQPGHPNQLAGGKRPFHTILPGLLLSAEGQGVGAFGWMGGQMQPQGHVQLVSGLAEGRAPQQVLDAPRWRWLDAGRVALEWGFDPAVARDLRERGHQVQESVPPWHFGGAQLVMRSGGGSGPSWIGASDRRKDGGVVRG